MNESTGTSNGSPAQSPLDRAVAEVMSRPLSPEELKGFGPARRTPPSVVPVVKVTTPSPEDGPKGYGVFVGVKGSF